MRTTARRSRRSTCTDTTAPCHRWASLHCMHGWLGPRTGPRLPQRAPGVNYGASPHTARDPPDMVGLLVKTATASGWCRAGLYGLAAGSAARRVHPMSAGVRFRVASAICPRDLPLEDSGKNRSGSADRQAASVCQFRSTSCVTRHLLDGLRRAKNYERLGEPRSANRVIADRDPALTDLSAHGRAPGGAPGRAEPGRPALAGANKQDQAAGSWPPQSRGLGDACSPGRI